MPNADKYALAQRFETLIEEFNEVVKEVEHTEHIVFLDWDCENHAYTRMKNYAQMMIATNKPF